MTGGVGGKTVHFVPDESPNYTYCRKVIRGTIWPRTNDWLQVTCRMCKHRLNHTGRWSRIATKQELEPFKGARR